MDFSAYSGIGREEKGPTLTIRGLPDGGTCPGHMGLFGEELAEIGERLKFQSVACGVEEEHCCLLTHLALETNIGLDDEIDAGTAKTVSQRLPLLHCKDDTKVGNGNVVTIDRIVVFLPIARRRFQMRNDLVAKEVEVYPLCRTSSFAAAQSCAVEVTGGVKVIDRKGEMEGSDGHGVLLALILRCRARNMNGANRLAAIKALVIAPQISIAEVRAIGAERTEGRVVAESIAKGASAFRMVSDAVVSIARAVVNTGTESLLLCALN